MNAIINAVERPLSAQPPENRDPETDEPGQSAAIFGSTVDEMSMCSFPASDPPAIWTWETHPAPAGKKGGDRDTQPRETDR
ncbi:MAG: hypothetical protein ACRDL6_09015 [Solirubrobacterales bacterium]